MTADTICHSPSNSVDNGRTYFRRSCRGCDFGRCLVFLHRSRFAASKRFKDEPAAGGSGKFRRPHFASRGKTDLPRVSIELIDAEIGVALFRSRIEFHIELVGICGIVECDRSFIDCTHTDAAESVSGDLHPCVCQHAAGYGLSFHFQFRNGPGALNQVQIVSHECVDIELRGWTQAEFPAVEFATAVHIIPARQSLRSGPLF